MARTTLGLIVGNRDVFPAELARRGREEMLAVLKKQEVDVVVLTPAESPDGVVMTWKDAEKCAKLFRDNAARIDGILVTLPNFGDERAVADSIRALGPVGARVRPRVARQGRSSSPSPSAGTPSAASFPSATTSSSTGSPTPSATRHVLSPHSEGSRRSCAGSWTCAGGARAERRADREHRRADHPVQDSAVQREAPRGSGISVESKSLAGNGRRDQRPLGLRCAGGSEAGRSSPATCPARRTSRARP